MDNLLLIPARQTYYVALCSGKGGVGKSTLALLLAARFAEQGRRTLLLDADLGIGDAATLSNSKLQHGFEELLTGAVSLKEAVSKIGARLWLLGTIPGSYLTGAQVTSIGIKECSEIDEIFDLVVVDTPSSLDPLYVGLIGAADLAITVTTPCIPAVADSYIQLKKVVESGSQAKHALLVNRVAQQVEGEQTKAKFAQLVRKFLAIEIDPLAALPESGELQRAGENQSLLDVARDKGEISAAAAGLAAVIESRYLSAKRESTSLWTRFERRLRPIPKQTFRDRPTLVLSESL